MYIIRALEEGGPFSQGSCLSMLSRARHSSSHLISFDQFFVESETNCQPVLEIISRHELRHDRRQSFVDEFAKDLENGGESQKHPHFLILLIVIKSATNKPLLIGNYLSGSGRVRNV